jgi:aldehyde:ferredoxin oxidoreductase
MHGWIGNILRINLTTGAINKEALDAAIAQQFIGGRGFGTYIMSREVNPSIDPLAAANKIIFAAGPLSGTNAPSASRWNVVTKGPLTGAIASSSSGGVFGAMLKYAGYDAIIVEGTAEQPVYIWIKDEKVEIRNASKLWGKVIPETTARIRALTDEDASVACIGPAGERLSPLANVINEYTRAAGRSGVGAVLGAKNLKAIAVRGTGAVRVPDARIFRDAMVRAKDKLKAHPIGGHGLRKYGTNSLLNVLNESGGLPTRNFREAFFPTAEKVGGESLSRKLLIRPRACFSCPISCGRATKVVNPEFKGQGEGPEYETVWAFGPACGVDDLDAVAKANYICNEYGLDTISLGSTVACAMDLFENGVITLKDTDGIALNFGDARTMVEMVRKAALGEGFGSKLSMGSYRLAESYGHPEYSMSVKKQEMPAYDPRALQGMGLNYATSNRGGCHVRGYVVAVEILGDPVKLDSLATEGKAEWDILFQNLTAAIDSSGMCLFSTFGLGGEDLAELLSAATGIPYTLEEYLKAGERIWNLERLYNLKAGLTAKDDTLPPRMLKDPIPGGVAQGHVNRLNEMLPDYYRLRGWDAAGVPSRQKLEALGLQG